MWTVSSRSTLALRATRAGGTALLCGCALSLFIIAGCANRSYSRFSGNGFYSMISSSYSPVYMYPEKRLEGDGICFLMNEGKAHVRGFVTYQDMSDAIARNPGLPNEALAAQLGFAEGMMCALRGFTKSRKARNVTHDEKIDLSEYHRRNESNIRAYIDSTVSVKDKDEWRRAFDRGLWYGSSLSRVFEQEKLPTTRSAE